MGATTDQARCEQAQKRMINELAPLYNELDDAMKELMDVNIQKGDAVLLYKPRGIRILGNIFAFVIACVRVHDAAFTEL